MIVIGMKSLCTSEIGLTSRAPSVVGHRLEYTQSTRRAAPRFVDRRTPYKLIEV